MCCYLIHLCIKFLCCGLTPDKNRLKTEANKNFVCVEPLVNPMYVKIFFLYTNVGDGTSLTAGDKAPANWVDFPVEMMAKH